MTHLFLRSSATLALLLTAAGWFLPWTVYPDGLGARTQVWALGPRRTWLVVALAIVGVVVLASAVVAWFRPGGRRRTIVMTALVVVAAAVAMTTVLVVDLGTVTWSGRASDDTDLGGAARIGRGVGLWLVAVAPMIAAIGAVAARVSDPTGRTPAPATLPAG